jgi:hypothetical protein
MISEYLNLNLSIYITKKRSLITEYLWSKIENKRSIEIKSSLRRIKEGVKLIRTYCFIEF